MNRYLPKDTCEYLASLGCVSESEYWWPAIDNSLGEPWNYRTNGYPSQGQTFYPAFDLADILAKGNAVTLARDLTRKRGSGRPMSWGKLSHIILAVYQSHPDTWTQEVAGIINPTTPIDS